MRAESAPQVIQEGQPSMAERLPEAMQQSATPNYPTPPVTEQAASGGQPMVKQDNDQPHGTEARPDLVSVPQSKPQVLPAPSAPKAEVRIPSTTSKPTVTEKPKQPAKTTTTPSIPPSISKSANKDILALRNELQAIAQPIFNRMLAAYRDSSINEINRSRFNTVQTDFRDAIMQRYYPLWEKYRKAGKVSERDFYVECSETWLYYCNNLYYQMQRNAGNSAYRNKHYHYYDKD
ncbi:MAG: hypothetical protein IJV05_06140 [Muribaculaceae bacterium]|nr:hypothetical protein [Muribaculaceae bacterium]